MISARDDLGRDVALAAPARRIVSLVPSLTETIFALGCGANLVGATRYCTEPHDLIASVHRVGGTKNPNLVEIRELAPDIVLLNAEENRREDFDALRDAGLTLFVSFPRRVADVPGVLRRLGGLCGAAPIADELARDLEAVLAESAAPNPSRRPRVFCPIWKNPWMSFNGDTYCHDILATAGAENVCRARRERLCSVSLEVIAQTDPEIVLLPDEPYVFGSKDLAALSALKGSSALRKCRVHFIDGKALSWYGVRTAGSVRYLRALLRAAALAPAQ